MDDAQAQGSAASPSVEDAGSQNFSVQDSINAHLSGGQTQEATTQPETSQPTEGEPQTEGQPEEPQGRAEQRIQDLIKQNTELQQRAAIADQLQMFIASNPQARAAYEQAINQGYSQEQAQQIATNQQPQQQSQGRWYGDIPQDRSTLPDWDPYDDNVVREHAKVLIHDIVADMMAPVLQQISPMQQFVQQQQMQQVQAENQKLVSGLDEMLYQEIPEAKTVGSLEFAVANQLYIEEMRGVEPEYQQALQNYAYLNPQQKQMVQDRFQKCVKDAASKAKQLLGQRAPQGQGLPAPQPAAVQRPFAEGGTNLVPPRGNEPVDLTGMISAHLNRSHS